MKHTHTHTHTNTPVHRAGLPCTNDQLDAEYSTYITHNKHETPIPSAIFEPALPAFERPQTFVLICTVAGIGVCHTHSSFNCLSYDRSKASSKTSCRHTAIQSFLLQLRDSCPFLKFIQQLPTSSSSHFYPSPPYLSFNISLQKTVATQNVTNPVSLPFTYFMQDIPLLLDSK